MRLHSSTILLLTVLALSCALPAEAQVRVCVDKQGRKSYQQGPCPTLDVATGIQPLKVANITESAIRKSVALANKAFAARDTASFLRFLSAGFTVEVTGGRGQPAGKVTSLDRARYAGTVEQLHRVMLGYEEIADGVKVALEPDRGIYSSHIRSRTRMPNGELQLDLDQTMTFVVESGQLVVSHMAETVRDEKFVESAAK